MLALATCIQINAKIPEKSFVFRDIKCNAFWDGLWKGFGNPKSMLFLFLFKNGSKKREEFRAARRSHFEASGANCGRSAAVRAAPGEGTKGWGKAFGLGI